MPVVLAAANAGDLYYILVLEGGAVESGQPAGPAHPPILAVHGDAVEIGQLAGPMHPRILICFVRGPVARDEIEEFGSRTVAMVLAARREHVFAQWNNVSISSFGFTLYNSHWSAEPRYRLLHRLWDAYCGPHNRFMSLDQYTFHLEYQYVCRFAEFFQAVLTDER